MRDAEDEGGLVESIVCFGTTSCVLFPCLSLTTDRSESAAPSGDVACISMLCPSWRDRARECELNGLVRCPRPTTRSTLIPTFPFRLIMSDAVESSVPLPAPTRGETVLAAFTGFRAQLDAHVGPPSSPSALPGCPS